MGDSQTTGYLVPAGIMLKTTDLVESLPRIVAVIITAKWRIIFGMGCLTSTHTFGVHILLATQYMDFNSLVQALIYQT